MTAEELQTLDYMHQIEQMYSCTSFEMAKLLRTEGTFRLCFIIIIHIFIYDKHYKAYILPKGCEFKA